MNHLFIKKNSHFYEIVGKKETNRIDDEIPFEKMELTTAVAEARRIVSLQNGPESYSYTLSGLKIGDAVFLGTPGELFTEIGVRISEKSPTPPPAVSMAV